MRCLNAINAALAAGEYEGIKANLPDEYKDLFAPEDM